jgi:hypothetical protein
VFGKRLPADVCQSCGSQACLKHSPVRCRHTGRVRSVVTIKAIDAPAVDKMLKEPALKK